MKKFNIFISLCLLSFSLFSINYDVEHAKKLLGYDPEITKLRSKSYDSKETTLFLHGYGKNQDQAYEFDDLLSSGNIIGINFHDAFVTRENPALTKTSFGQMSDIKPTLYVLKNLVHENNIEKLNILAYSRGAGTFMNALAVLNDKSGKYADVIKHLGINDNEKTNIINSLQAGSIALICPLTHVQQAMIMRAGNERIKLLKKLENKLWFQKINAVPGMQKIGAGLGWLFDQSAGRLANYCYMPLVSQYRPWGPQAINSAQELGGLNLKTLVHFEDHDRTVSNNLDTELAQRLAQHNPQETYISKSSSNFTYKTDHLAQDDGLLNGHTGPFEGLKGPFHTFRKHYNLVHNQQFAQQCQNINCYRVINLQVINIQNYANFKQQVIQETSLD